MRITVPFVGGHSQGDSLELRSMLCDNMYPEMSSAGSKAAVSLRKIPGLTTLETMAAGFGRGNGAVFETTGEGLLVIGDTLYSIDQYSNVSEAGKLLTTTGPVSIAAGRTEVGICDGEYLYKYDGTNLTVIASPPFGKAWFIVWTGSYFIVAKRDTDQFYVTLNPDDLTTFDALRFATAEGQPDKLYTPVPLGGFLILLGDVTAEIYAHTGDVDFPFERIPGGVIDWGIQAPWSLAKNDYSLYWLAKNEAGGNTVLQANLAGAVKRISPPDIEQEIEKFAVANDATAFIYRQGGHEFYQLTFPAADKTFCYDISSGHWHTRSAADGGRHEAAGYLYFNSRHFVTKHDTSEIAWFDRENHTPRWKRRFQVVHHQNRFIRFKRLEQDFEHGTALKDGPAGAPVQGSDPVMMLGQSNDGGNNWLDRELWRKMGRRGDYKKRCVWSGINLPAARNKVFELSGSDPIKTVLYNTYVSLEVPS